MAFIGGLIAIIRFSLGTLFGERAADEIMELLGQLVIGALKLLRVLFSLFVIGLIIYGIYALFASIFS